MLSFFHGNRSEKFVTVLTFLPSLLLIFKLNFNSYEYFFMVAFLLSFLSYGPFLPLSVIILV